jgi:hypothetical protein
VILDNSPNEKAEIVGVESVTDFKIKASAKAFDILSSGLYSDKPRAIVRELSCNAYDSHVAAGCPEKPFDVHLPNTFSPKFSIRDYGTGLDHDEVVNVYTTYFESTKTDSNDFVGALGLGSKSPFSYTNNFTVIAYKNGVKRNYSVFTSDAGVPTIALLSESETDESNGLEVTFAVTKQMDFHSFSYAASEVYRYFNTRPNITGNSINIPDLKLKNEIIPGGYLFERRSVAVMGNVAYPVHWSSVYGAGWNDKFYYQGFYLQFDIGELDFQASREGLQYTRRTREALAKKRESLLEAVDKYTKEALENNSADIKTLYKFIEENLNDSQLYKKSINDFLEKNYPSMAWRLSGNRYLLERADIYGKNPSKSWFDFVSRSRCGGPHTLLNHAVQVNTADGKPEMFISSIERSYNRITLTGHNYVSTTPKVFYDAFQNFLKTGVVDSVSLGVDDEKEAKEFCKNHPDQSLSYYDIDYYPLGEHTFYLCSKSHAKYTKSAKSHFKNNKVKSAYYVKCNADLETCKNKIKEIFSACEYLEFVTSDDLDALVKNDPSTSTKKAEIYLDGVYFMEKISSGGFKKSKRTFGLGYASEAIVNKKFFYYNTLNGDAEVVLGDKIVKYKPEDYHGDISKILNLYAPGSILIYANSRSSKTFADNKDATDISHILEKAYTELISNSCDLKKYRFYKRVANCMLDYHYESDEHFEKFATMMNEVLKSGIDVSAYEPLASIDDRSLNLDKNYFLYSKCFKLFRGLAMQSGLDLLQDLVQECENVKSSGHSFYSRLTQRYPVLSLVTVNKPGDIDKITQYVKYANYYSSNCSDDTDEDS